MKNFSNYAQYYDLLNQGKDYKAEVKYIISLFRKYGSNPKRIMDMGCGTGKHSILFAENGYQVLGVDQSPEMIKIANNRLKKNPNIDTLLDFAVSDVTAYRTEETFDSVISLFHVMSYQTTNDDLNNALQTAYNHLFKGGLFIFDCWYGPAVLSDKPYVRTKVFEDEKCSVKRIAYPELHVSKDIVDVNFDITITNKNTKQSTSFNELHSMRYLFEPEIKLLLSANNFEFLHAEEWLTGKKPSFDSWYVTFICRKR